MEEISKKHWQFTYKCTNLLTLGLCFLFRKLAVKEAQERHLTEEWTEKWKEAANILKEQQALALKRTGQGVMLDSEKPHLVNIWICAIP